VIIVRTARTPMRSDIKRSKIGWINLIGWEDNKLLAEPINVTHLTYMILKPFDIHI
jgi:hypothetical protein